ncbi:hypothetical protein [Chryseolinea lacunae]|uniref:DUF4199 domain-containing protein n=1 Tax=Chryseolinea lacunae TaxID=2801331 RepID=A0ABS1KSZ8_9BACT|nr:hypothetical protein [Chryseolinea lacunae]MBL0742347.1 hypothetical protein [Chryseolinea lacunae]
MRYIFLMVVCAFSLSHSVAQTTTDTDLRMEKNFWGIKFYQGSKLLKPAEVLNIMKPNDQAYAAFKKAKTNADAASVVGFVGGALIGWPLGTAIAGGDPQWGLAAGGAALLLIGIPLSQGFTKNANMAFDLYNHGDTTAKSYAPKMYVGVRGAGVGVAVRF